MAKYKLQELNDLRDEGKRRVYPKMVTNRTLSRKEFVKMMQNYHRGISESTTEAVPGLCLTGFGVLWMFLIDCSFIIADYPSKSISFGHFHSPKMKGSFCAGCTKQKRLPPRGKLSPKVTDEGRVCAATLLRAITASSPLIRPTATFPQGGRHDTFQINFPVLLSGFRFTSAGVPQATTRPPSSPPPGPMSMR